MHGQCWSGKETTHAQCELHSTHSGSFEWNLSLRCHDSRMIIITRRRSERVLRARPLLCSLRALCECVAGEQSEWPRQCSRKTSTRRGETPWRNGAHGKIEFCANDCSSSCSWIIIQVCKIHHEDGSHMDLALELVYARSSPRYVSTGISPALVLAATRRALPQLHFNYISSNNIATRAAPCLGFGWNKR